MITLPFYQNGRLIVYRPIYTLAVLLTNTWTIQFFLVESQWTMKKYWELNLCKKNRYDKCQGFNCQDFINKWERNSNIKHVLNTKWVSTRLSMAINGILLRIVIIFTPTTYITRISVTWYTVFFDRPQTLFNIWK